MALVRFDALIVMDVVEEKQQQKLFYVHVVMAKSLVQNVRVTGRSTVPHVMA